MNKLFLRFRRDIGGLLWLALALFVGLALYSYSPTDPSFNSIGKGLKSSNLCGYFGSFLADALLQGLGLAAWLIVIAALRMSYTYFVGKKSEARSTQIVWLVLLLATGASLLSVYFPKTILFDGQIRIGGLVGVLLSSGLERVFNFAGAVLILWTLVAVLVIFYTETPLGDILRKPLSLLRRLMPVVSDTYLRLQSQLVAGFENLKLRPALNSGPKANAARFSIDSASEERRFVLKSQSLEESKIQAAEADQPSENSGELPADLEPTRAARRKVVLRAKVQRRVENWELPKIQLLEDPPATRRRVDEKEIKSKARLLADKLAQFSVRGEVTGIKPGPSVTMFEFKPAADVKISKITDLADDLSLAMSSESVRIIAPIPGRDVVGIETSNSVREAVYLKDIIADEEFWNEEIKLPLALGRQADGETKIVDLRKMPHLLVAGTTGSGKSVFVVSLLTGLLFRHSPKTLKLILVDPKQVDLAAFNEIPHLIMPPIREAKKAVGALRWAIREMEKRYRSMSRFGARGLESFNEIVGALKTSQIEEHERANQAEGDRPNLESYYYTAQPYICIVVEEFGDLMAVDKANVEQAVVRLAQMARACGIHLILAMQSPRKDVVTGLIKTNIPGRVSFKVASKMDSRIILDESGAERLLARGDMLFQAPGVSKPERHHGPFLSEEEIARVVSNWKSQGEPEYDPSALRAIEGSGGGYDLEGESAESNPDTDDIKDERYDEILAYVAAQKDISASLLQRRFRLGYPRAARMIEIFESEGVVGPANGSKPRQVLVRDLK